MVKTKRIDLTPPQKRTLDALSCFIAQYGFPPKLRDLARILGIGTSSVRSSLIRLAEKGYISKPSSTNSIKILKGKDDPCRRIIELPLLGTVVAGTPINIEEHREGIVCIESSIRSTEDCFVVRAFGESMIDAGIRSGDLLIVHQQPLANNGEIVIASINGEITVKTLWFIDGDVALIPANKSMSPIKVGTEDDFRILGVVLEIKAISKA